MIMSWMNILGRKAGDKDIIKCIMEGKKKFVIQFFMSIFSQLTEVSGDTGMCKLFTFSLTKHLLTKDNVHRRYLSCQMSS